MWGLLVFDVMFFVFVLYAMGYPLCCIFSRLDDIRLSVAPLLELAVIFALANLYVLLGVKVSWIGIVAPLATASVLASIWCCLKKRGSGEWRLEIRLAERWPKLYLLLYIAIGLVVVSVYYLHPLDSAASIFQEYDNYSHLSQVRTYLNTGSFADGSLLGYPELWRTATALVASFGASQVAVAANAVNFTLMAVVLPIGFWSFLKELFPEDSNVIFAGAVVSLAFGAFPWGLVSFGPLYPNLLGMVLLLPVMLFFIRMFDSHDIRNMLFWIAAFIFGVVVLIAAHPNSVFSGIVILTPFALSRLYRNSRSSGRDPAKSLALSALFGVSVVLFWLACYCSSPFAAAVSFNWPAFRTLFQAVIGFVTLNWNKFGASQFLLAAILFVGMANLLFAKKERWLVASFLLAGAMLVIDESGEGAVKHLLTGFWYTDSYRVAAMTVLAGVPLASCGLAKLLSFVQRCFSLESKGAMSACLIFTGLALFFPSVTLNQSEITGTSEVLTTEFGYLHEYLTQRNSMADDYGVYDLREQAFVEKVKQIVGDSNVLNFPYDGSLFAYAVNNLNVVNRHWHGYSMADDANMWAITTGVDRVSYDSSVREALNKEGIHYLILLDYGRSGPAGMYLGGYEDDDWRGMLGVNDQTPGLTLLLSEGDMRLYSISGVN